MQATHLEEGFWAGRYHGRSIAVFNHSGGWLVYIDHVLQPRMLFDSAEAAVSWLQRKIDRRTGHQYDSFAQ